MHMYMYMCMSPHEWHIAEKIYSEYCMCEQASRSARLKCCACRCRELMWYVFPWAA